MVFFFSSFHRMDMVGATPADGAATTWSVADRTWIQQLLCAFEDQRLVPHAAFEEACSLWAANSPDGLLRRVPESMGRASPVCRWQDATLRSGFTLFVWHRQATAMPREAPGTTLLPACEWCGLPTGNFCDSCYFLGVAWCRALCTWCEGLGIGTCRQCVNAGEVQHPNTFFNLGGDGEQR